MLKNHKPVISVCITTYNHERYIRDCINSVMQQDIDVSFEILIGNDASTDSTTTIIEELVIKNNKKIKHIHHKNNIGAFENLKFLVNIAQGDYIAHLDGDDFWQVGKLQAQYNFLEENKTCSVCYTNAWIVDDKLMAIGLFNNDLPKIFDLEFLLIKGNFLNHSSIMYRREYKKCVTDNVNSFIDYKIHICLAIVGTIGFINIPYVTYRHASSQSLVKNSNDLIRKLYFEAILYAFSQKALFNIHDIIYINFTARIVKDSISKKNIPILKSWVKEIRKNTSKNSYKILLFGFVGGVHLLMNALLKRMYRKLNIGGEIYVANKR